MAERPSGQSLELGNELQRDVYLRIYDCLKGEIEVSVKDARDMERSTLLLCGAIWTYLAGRCPNPVPPFLWYVPAILAGFGAVRTAALMISIRPRAQYLRTFEDRTLKDGPLPGWEVYFRSHYRRGVGFTVILFWMGLLAATIIIPQALPEHLCRAAS